MKILVGLVVLVLVLCQYGAQGGRSRKNMTLEEQLKVLNKTTMKTSHHQASEEDYDDCEIDYDDLMPKCDTTLKKLECGDQWTNCRKVPWIDPTAGCCFYIQDADLQCICRNYIDTDKDMEDYIISVPKLVRLAEYCGNPFPHKFKCGSKI
ncbi:hypothetical protein FRX31_011542 [Thalictrum thalictroides]|uniref:Bifunctional inhibitor/plant lipid transfer protein/seed storage helical domain-containing protein n=1 Tax=Thalictrum thalictroides TaxID=46969 RepID=A0A7J6WRY0_THATH|nr:hypothetical protein FRX31_011542 [Thalictrum thalictroides]